MLRIRKPFLFIIGLRLERDPKRRLRDIGDAVLEFEQQSA